VVDVVLLSLAVHSVLVFFFFFQAEDGLRDKLVTGVQTCALPISGFVRNAVPSSMAIAIPHAATTDGGDTSVRRCRRPKTRGSCPCSPSEYASRPKPEIDVVAAVRDRKSVV